MPDAQTCWNSALVLMAGLGSSEREVMTQEPQNILNPREQSQVSLLSLLRWIKCGRQGEVGC